MLSEAQRRVLERAPDDWAPWRPMYRVPHYSLNPTTEALERLGFIECRRVPLMWRRTAAGRAVLEADKDG